MDLYVRNDYSYVFTALPLSCQGCILNDPIHLSFIPSFPVTLVITRYPEIFSELPRILCILLLLKSFDVYLHLWLIPSVRQSSLKKSMAQNLEHTLRTMQLYDSAVQPIRRDCTKGDSSDFTLDEHGTLFFKGRLVVPKTHNPDITRAFSRKLMKFSVVAILIVLTSHVCEYLQSSVHS